MTATRILYVEAENRQRVDLAAQLREQGYIVSDVSSGEDALVRIESSDYDLLLSSLHLPGMSGIELLANFKQKYPEVPFIVLTSQASTDMARKAITAGADQFVTKPTTLQSIELAVSQSLERVKLLKQLRQSQKDLRMVMDNVLDIVYTVDTDGNFTMVSPAVRDLLGYAPEELIGKSAFKLVPDEHRAGVKAAFEGSIGLSTGAVRSQIMPLTAKNGEVRQFEVSTHVIFDDGRPIAEYGIARDVTERMSMEAELLANSRELEKRTKELHHANRELNVRNEELQRSVSIAQAILNTTQSAILLVNPGGEVSVVNQSVGEFFGVDAALVQKLSFSLFIERVRAQFEDQAAFAKLIESLEKQPDDPHDYMTDTELLPRQLRMIRPEERYLSVLSFVVQEEGDDYVGRLWIFVDMSKAHKSDELVRTLVKASPIASIIARVEDGEILYANEALGRMIGLPEEEMIGLKTPNFYANTEDRTRVMSMLKEQGFCKDMEVQLMRHDGSSFWAVLSLVLGEMAGQKVTIGAVYDIDERKEAEQELRRERNFVAAVLDTIGALVVVLDREGRIVRFNRTCEKLTGYSHTEVLNKPYDELFLLEEDRDRVNALVERLLAGEYPLYGENHWLTRDGERRMIAWSNTVLTDDEGNVTYIIATGIDVTDRREAEEKLRLYRRIYENALDGITIFTPDGQLIESNPAMQTTSGFSLDTLKERSIAALVGEEFFERAGNALREHGRYRGESLITTADGEKKSVEISLFTIKGDDGEVAYLSGIGRDISERKAAEMRIERRLQYEQALADCSRILLETSRADDAVNGVLRTIRLAARADRAYLFENFIDNDDRFCCRQLYEIVGEGISAEISNPDLQHVSYRDVIPRWQLQLAAGNEVFGRVEEFPQAEREILEPQQIKAILVIPVRVGGDWWGFVGLDDCTGERTIDDEDRRVLRTAAEMLGVYIERRHAQDALRSSEERFRSLVENANEIIYSVNPSGALTYLSPNWKQILGWEVGDAVGRGMERFVCPQDSERWQSFIARVLGEGGSGEIEYRMKHKDGSLRWYHTSASAQRDADGKIVGGVGVAHDVTEMRSMLSSLEQANKELRDAQSQLVQSEKMASLGMLVAGIAHEINTPIGAVGSMHNTLMRSIERLRAILNESSGDLMQSNEQVAKLLKVIDDANQVIQNGTGRVTTIVRRLRSFARLDEAEVKSCNVRDGIEDTLTLIHHEIKHGIEIVRDYEPLPEIACFPGKLNQVFLNILNNARQAMHGKGTITIRTRNEGKHIRIDFADTGDGIAPENLKRIFDPGFTTKGVGVGTGLGLSICYQILQDHRGRIEVSSELGRGTTFTLFIPTDLDDSIGSKSEAPSSDERN